jgi:hypothetical protein
MNWDAIKLVGVVVSLVGGALTIGEKLCRWGKFTYQSLKKIHSGNLAKKEAVRRSVILKKICKSNQSGIKKIHNVELKPRALKKILNTWFETSNFIGNKFSVSLSMNVDLLITNLHPISHCAQRMGRFNRF